MMLAVANSHHMSGNSKQTKRGIDYRKEVKMRLLHANTPSSNQQTNEALMGNQERR